MIVDVAVDPPGGGSAWDARSSCNAPRALLALGHTEARLWVTDSNRPARALYESLGFDPEATALIVSRRRPGPESPAGPSPQTAR